ncbi:uncharacterized protein H6S33_010563 [Morchella sextelata]|uniref:uncharacterized protein n=1 Tax=Morchella sextelata TaxID=1174677 RepID=UPI001D03C8C9|nr:uncharacterized protein H6S33_010563 [Morchella sextelata]KAH0611298.1 hypothetical protein H6S33_010563 [Morchella sextelata]
MSFRLTPSMSTLSLSLPHPLHRRPGAQSPGPSPRSPRAPHSHLTAPRRLMRKLRSYVTPRKLQRRYLEKRLYGDSYDFESSADDDDDENDDGFVVVAVPRWTGSLRVRGEKRAGVAAWEVESRSRMV